MSIQASLAKLLEELQALFHLSPFSRRAYAWCISAVVSLALVISVFAFVL
jgi:hypothetical protein